MWHDVGIGQLNRAPLPILRNSAAIASCGPYELPRSPLTGPWSPTPSRLRSSPPKKHSNPLRPKTSRAGWSPCGRGGIISAPITPVQHEFLRVMRWARLSELVLPYHRSSMKSKGERLVIPRDRDHCQLCQPRCSGLPSIKAPPVLPPALALGANATTVGAALAMAGSSLPPTPPIPALPASRGA